LSSPKKTLEEDVFKKVFLLIKRARLFPFSRTRFHANLQVKLRGREHPLQNLAARPALSTAAFGAL
jgi:hypothetical protein